MRASLFLLRYLNPPKEYSFKVKKYLANIYIFLTGSMAIFNLLKSHQTFNCFLETIFWWNYQLLPSYEPNNIFQPKIQNYKYIQRSIQILFFPVLLFEMVKREETLLNVMQSVTKNIRSILFTALLAIILVYLFSIVGFVFFQEDFLIEAEDLPSAPSSSCQGKFIYMLPFSM